MRTQMPTPGITLPNVATRFKSVTIPVPYRKPGNVVAHLPIEFEVHQSGDEYEAFPLLSKAHKRLIYLPSVIPFTLRDGKMTNKKYEFIVDDIRKQLAKKLY